MQVFEPACLMRGFINRRITVEVPQQYSNMIVTIRSIDVCARARIRCPDRPNDTGKTTLFDVIVGSVRCDQGDVLLGSDWL